LPLAGLARLTLHDRHRMEAGPPSCAPIKSGTFYKVSSQRPGWEDHGKTVWGERGSGRIGVDKAAQRQRRHVLHVIVAEMTATAHGQHGGDPPQIQVTLFDRHRARHGHHGRKLIIGQTKHVG
jgi:hypothetical protein